MHKFEDNLECKHGKNVNDILDRKITCEGCMRASEEAIKSIATRGVFGHLWDAFVCFFNFDFIGTLAEIQWAIERLTKTGDYNPETGDFYEKGYLKKR